MTEAGDRTALDHFLRSCLAEIERRASLAQDHAPSFAEGVAAFRAALDGAARVRAHVPPPVPATEVLAELPDSPLTRACAAAARAIPWTTSPRLDDGGRDIALGRVDEVLDLGGVNCGTMLVRAGAVYPEHSHPPDELYLPITGHDAEWRFGGRTDYRRLGPDELVYNPPDGVHGTLAHHEHVLALYVLW